MQREIQYGQGKIKIAVRFPLEVENGVKAGNISELKENFDI